MSHRGQHAYVSFCFLNGISGTITNKTEVEKKLQAAEEARRLEAAEERRSAKKFEEYKAFNAKAEAVSSLFETLRFEAEENGFPLLNHREAKCLFLEAYGVEGDFDWGDVIPTEAGDQPLEEVELPTAGHPVAAPTTED